MPDTKVKSVYALVGADSFMQLQKLAGILRLMPPDVQRMEADGERAELAEVLDELRSFAMFGGAKLVVVRSAEAFITRFREQLENYVAHPSDSATLVLRLPTLPSTQRIYKAIAKVGQIENCNPPKDVVRWIIAQGSAGHGLSVDLEAAQLLAELIGDDLGRLDNELAKLALFAEQGKLTKAQIGATVSFQREQEMWDMTNELAMGNPAEALRRWRQLVQLDPSSEFRAVTWLGMWLENVRKAQALMRRGLNQFAIAKQLRIWPSEIQAPFMKTAQTLGPGGVARALDLLAEIDHQSKSGVGEAASNVERFILQMGTSITAAP